MKKLFTLFGIAMCFIFLSNSISYAQIYVTVTNPTNTTPNMQATYSSFATALTDLNLVSAMSGPVTLTLSTGSETTPPTGLTIGSATLNPVLNATNTVTINTVGGAVTLNAGVGTATPTSAAPDGILKIVGANYITIDGLTFIDGNTTNPATMEYGLGLFKLNLSDGAQYNTISNCIFNMQRVNNASGSSPMVEGSVGILVINSIPTAATTALVPTTAAGTNSYNKFYSNTINGGNYGIVLSGYSAATPFTAGDTGNDIGGSSASTGNTILNFGGAASATNPSAGIRANNQWGINISYNTINNNNGSGVNHVYTLRGIYAQAGTSANATISYNNITVKSGGTTTQVSAIENAIGSTAASNTINITNNTIQNCTYTTATTATVYYIYNSSSAATVNINSNTITNNSSAGTGNIYCIEGGSPPTLNENNNNISNISKTGIGVIYCLKVTSPTTSTASGNTIDGINQTAASSTGAIYGYYSLSSAVTETASNNIMRNFISTGASTIAGIRLNSAAGSKTFQNNQIYNVTAVGGGSLYGLYLSIGTINATGNQIYNYRTTISGSFYGIYNVASAASLTHTYQNNVIKNFNCPSGSSTTMSVYGIYSSNSSSATVNCSGNTIDSLVNSGRGNIYGTYFSTQSNLNVYGNTISRLRSEGTGASGQITPIFLTSGATGVTNVYQNTIYGIYNSRWSIFGIYSSSGLTTNIYKNNLYDFNAPQLGSGGDSCTVYAIASGSSTTTAVTNIYNNFVSDIKWNGTRYLGAGIYTFGSTSGTTFNYYYNTVFMNMSSTNGVASGAIFHSTTPTVDMRNNIAVNISTFGTGGKAVAHWRNSTTLTTFASTSNNNLYYAGTPSSTTPIYYDGTNLYNTLADYKTIVATRDAAAVTEMPPFMNSSLTPYNLHINTAIPTYCESGGTPVSSVTTDYDGDTRNATTPDIGADEFTGITFNPPPVITYTPLQNTQSTSNRNLIATIIDATDGVPTTGIGLPVLYWKINSGSYTGSTSTFIGSNQYSFDFGTGVNIGDVVSYYICAQDNLGNTTSSPYAGASGFSANPPAASTPPSSPNSYTIANTALSGDYTVGSLLFNKITGKNITFQKVIKKVWVDEIVEDKTNKSNITDSKNGKVKDQLTTNKDEKLLSSKVKGITRKVEVEKIEWVPMENGKEYKGDLFVKKSQHPELNYPSGVNGIYITLTAAIADLNIRGVSGSTRFLLNDPSYTTGETYPLNVNINNDSYMPTSTNTVTIKPNVGVTAEITGASPNSNIFKISNNYVTIDGSNSIGGTTRNLSITNTSTTAPQVIAFYSSGTTPVVGSGIKNCIITNGTQSSSAVVLTDAGGTAGYFNNMSIQNNLIQLAYIGVFYNAVLSGTNGNGTVISGNNLNSTGTNAIRLVGIYVQGAYGTTVSNNTIANFEAANTEVDKGIWFATGTNNSTISNNTISALNYSGTSTSSYPYGIAITTGVAASNITVSGNTISGFTCSGGDGVSGIFLSGATGGVRILANKIYSLTNSNTGGYAAWGIMLSSSLTASNIEVTNNMLYDIKAYGYSSTIYENGIGILLYSGGGYSVYYNTVNLATNQSAGISACLMINSTVSTASSVDVRNNIFTNSETVGVNYGIYSASANTIFSAINYNDYFASDATTGKLGYLGGNITTLTAWQTATGKDGNSVSGDPKYLSATNLHIDPYAISIVNNAGTPLAGITTDIDGDTRNATTPDIGADEYNYIPPAVENPTAFTASSPNPTQINLGWTNNLNNDNVMVAFNTTSTIGTPDPEIAYNPGDPIPGGGTVIYLGVDGYFEHSGLTESTPYYYKAWSVDAKNTYSTGVITNATTLCANKTIPYTQGFNSTTLPSCWTTQTVVGTSAIQFVPSSSNPTTTPQEGADYVFWNSYNTNWADGNETRLVSPRITTTGSASVDAKFYWFNDNNTSYNYGSYLLEGVQVQYSLDGITWVNAGSFVPRHDGTLTAGTGQWKLKTITLPAGAGNQASVYVGFKFHSSFGDNCSMDNVTIQTTPTVIDVGPLTINQTGITYFRSGTTSIPMTGVVKNFGTTTETFVVTRKILGTSYSSQQTITSLAAGTTANVTFDDFTGFTSGTSYTIKDSTYLVTDGTANNDTLSKVYTPFVAKINCVYWNDAASRDSLLRCMNNSGMTTDDYDVLSMTAYTGSLRPWATVWVLFPSAGNWTSALRDSMKAFVDNSEVTWKKTLLVFGNDLGYNHDRVGSTYTTTADSTFYRYYLKSRYLGDSWLTLTPSAGNKFKGSPDYSFPTITSDSCSDAYPDFVLPVNGGSSAFIPLNRVSNNDTVSAVYYAGATWNMFYATNTFSGYRTKADGTKNAQSVFYAITNWIGLVGGSLPVQMSAFNSTVEKNNVTLNWITSSEINNRGFDIERKIANGNWMKVGNIQGNNTKNTPTNYKFEDKKLNTGKYNYRLKQIDLNGNYKYFILSTTVEIGVPKSFNLSQNYPNPFNPVTKIDFELPRDSKVRIVLFDILGREVKTLVAGELKQAGFYTIELNAINLASGTYFYRMIANSQNKDNIFTKKMVIVK